MDIDIKEVIDYCQCPMLYKLKYCSPELKTKYINILEKYDHDIHKTIYSFFASIQENRSTSIGVLTHIWGKLWIGNKSMHDIIYADTTSWRDTQNERRKKGISTILNIFNMYKNSPGLPLVINKQYKVPITKSINLTGTWEIIRETQSDNTKVIEIIDYRVDDKFHNKINLHHDLEMSAASYAFREIFITNEDRIIYYGLEKNKIQHTSRDKDDYEILKHTVKCVATAIHNKLFYACPDSRCYSCSYKGVCNDNFSLKNMV